MKIYIQTISFMATIVMSLYLGNQYAWHQKDWFEKPWQSVGLLVLVLVAISFLIWGMIKPKHWKTFAAFILGIAAAVWADKLIDGIGWVDIAIIIGGVFVIVCLWSLTVRGRLFGTAAIRQRLPQPTPATDFE